MPSVGVRNKNYLNVKNGSDPWRDANGSSRTDSKGHAVFSDPAYGVRAGLLQLRAYFLKRRLRTVIDILSTWAPASDTVGSIAGNPRNNPSAYAVFVADRMGVRPDQPLELFHDDGTVDNLGQLRALFSAMAAYEIGDGFVVPARELDRGLELIQRDITRDGTPARAALPTVADEWRIRGSVGRADRGAANDPADVEAVQSMLRTAAMLLENPRIDPGPLDGEILARASMSSTVGAIVAFQSRFLARPDGMIDVDGRTWRELVAVVSGGRNAAPAPTGAECFPLAEVPSTDWTTGARAFCAARGGNRVHAACDLYAPKGTIIHAIADGTVVRGPYEFYGKTFALEVDHGSFIARYGEIQEETLVQAGDRVTCGQPIAKVGHLQGIQVSSDMLHLEIYDKTAHGPLTTDAANGKRAPDGRPFMRRKDLNDPTPLLARWKDTLPASSVTTTVVTTPTSSVTRVVTTPAASSATTVVTTTVEPPSVQLRGFCLLIRRLRQEHRDGKTYDRTVAEYQCFWNGAAIHDLDGQMVERGGPGDNSKRGDEKDLRIAAGTYPLSIHAGTKYKTYGYAASGEPRPGLLLMATGERTAILIHPAHHSDGYVSSVGCLNPAAGLTGAAAKVDLPDSFSRTVAIIDALKQRLGTRFPRSGPIPGATVVVEGEPT